MVARRYDQSAFAHSTATHMEYSATGHSLSKTLAGTESHKPVAAGSWPLCLSGTASPRSKGISYHLCRFPSAYLGCPALWSAWRYCCSRPPLQPRHCRDYSGRLSILHRQFERKAALLTIFYGHYGSHDPASGSDDGRTASPGTTERRFYRYGQPRVAHPLDRPERVRTTASPAIGRHR